MVLGLALLPDGDVVDELEDGGDKLAMRTSIGGGGVGKAVVICVGVDGVELFEGVSNEARPVTVVRAITACAIARIGLELDGANFLTGMRTSRQSEGLKLFE